MKRVLVLAWLMFVMVACAARVPTPQPSAKTPPSPAATATPAMTWPAQLTVGPSGQVAIAQKSYPSSSQLLVNWRPYAEAVDHYEVSAIDSLTAMTATSAVTQTQVALSDLKSGTSYTVTLKACPDRGCARSAVADAIAVGATAEEYWQFQGTGNSFSSVQKIVADGGTNPSVFCYGEWAGPELAGTVRLYYKSSPLSIKTADMAAEGEGLVAWSHFDPVEGYGFCSYCEQGGCPGNTLMANVCLFQAIPLSEAMGGSVRLFIEAEDSDKRRRIVYLDSEDGYVGRDFCRGPGTICQTLADYSAGGACEPKVAIGLEGDAVAGKAGILNAFQFEVGYPTLDDWRWDAAPGTFMLFNCGAHVRAPSSATGSTCYAVWDGSEWQVQHDLSGRPEVFPLMAVPAPVHLGGARYKLYFRKGTPMTPRPPPPFDVRVIYADGMRTGNPAWVDYEDWESVYASRQVNYLWPDGTLVDDVNEGTLDDFVFFMPTSDPHLQLMYTACAVPGGVEDPDGGIAIAVLVNP